MKKKLALVLNFLFFTTLLFCQTKYTAEELKNLALEEKSVEESIAVIKAKSSSMVSLSDRRSILYYLGRLQEEMSMYSDAAVSYATAAGISASDAKNMQKVSSEELVLFAVAASLNAGEYSNAASYLSSAVSSSSDQKILAWVKLYQVWTDLCRAESLDSAKDSVELLKAYSLMDSMKSLRPQILFTLWYVTDSPDYKNQLKKEYPSSPENKICQGKAELVVSPFWYFMPHANHSPVDGELSLADSSGDSSDGSSAKESTSTKENSSTKDATSSKNSSSNSETEKAKYLQLGLFKEKANADALVAKAKSKGFSDAHYYTEKRPSGTLYFIVVVSENAEGNMSLKLKDAGFENYPLYE